jgi:hypothetical protein
MRAFGPEADIHIVSKPIDSDTLLRLFNELLFR